MTARMTARAAPGVRPAPHARRALGPTGLTALGALGTLAALAAVAALGACKARQRESPRQDPPKPADAAPADADLDACRQAAARVPGLPATQRAQALLDGCRPCGDWEPLLAWNTPASAGGPTRAAIEQAMLACKAFCEPNAKQRFLGTLDGARGQDSRAPWRFLGEICKAEVSALPDTRFMGAPYFALDRIARAIGDPALLAAITVSLPAVSLTGVGIELPSSPVSAPEAGPAALTVDASQILLGTLPVATLSAGGLQVTGDYPGTPVAPKALAAALATPALAGHPIAVLAPTGLAAARLVEVIGAAGGHDLRLAVASPGPRGWTLPGTVPIALVDTPAHAAAAGPTGVAGPTGPARAAAITGIRLALDANPDEVIKVVQTIPRADLARAPVTIAIGPTATVASLASLLGALGAVEVKAVVLVASPAQPSSTKPSPAKP
jgi:hypothetical protein